MVHGSLANIRRPGTHLRFWIAISLALALSLFVVFNISNASADTSTTVVVHSSDVGTSWYSGPPATTRSGGSVSFATGPATAPLGSGSLQLNTTDANGTVNAKAQMFNYSYEGTSISDLTALSYSEYHSSASSSSSGLLHASINIEITDPTLGFKTLIFEPYEQSGFSNTNDTWSSWNTLSGQWWVNNYTFAGNTTQFQTVSWSTVLSIFGNATITGGVGFNVGSGWNGTTVNYADALSIDVGGTTTTYDFEPTPANNVTMTVENSDGSPISGATVSYTSGSTGYLGNTGADGTISGHLAPGNYTFYATYHGTRSAIYGPVSVTNDAVTTNTFQTMKAQVNLQTCDGTGVAGGQARFTNGSIYYFGSATDANGVATYEFFPGTYDVEMDFTNAAVHQTVDFNSTSSVTFNTVPVTLLNTGSISYRNAAGGSTAYYTGPTMQMLPASYTFLTGGTSFDVTVPAGCSGTPGFTGGVVRLVDHNGNGLAGGTASYYAGGWNNLPGTTDANGNLVFSAPSNFTYLRMNYKGGILQQSRAQLDTSHYTFQTVLATVKLENADGNPLDTGSVTFYAGGWQTFGTGTTSGGQVTMELLPTSYSFAMVYNGTRQQLDGQNIATNPVVTFQTGRLSLYFSGTIQWYGGGWLTFSKPTMEFLPGTITYYLGGAGGCQAPVTIASGDHLVKSAIVATLTDHAGTKVAGGEASAYVGGWQSMGTTNTSGVVCKLFDGQLGNVSVAMVYNGTRQQITQNQPTNSVYAFQAGQVTIELKDSTGALIDTGDASYYAGGWNDLGNTNGGKVTVDILPGSYSFAMVYNGEREQLNNQAVVNGSTVVFQTVKANVQLLDSTGAGIEGGAATYYAGGWHTFGTTDSSGNAYQEMLPGSYSFAMVFEGERQQLNGQDVSSPVTFQTVLATVKLTSSNGTALAGGDVSYYAGGWQTFGTTDASGQATREMLPGSYSFAMVYLGGRQQLNGQNVANTIAYQTGQVHSDSGTATSYYAGGWHTFTQDMELLPGSYAFHFSAHAQTNYTVTGGTENYIF